MITIPPIRIAVGFSRCREAFSVGIRYFTRPQSLNLFRLADWSHEFLVFEFPGGRREIHEALMSDGWTLKPFHKLRQWQEKSPDHQAELLWLPMVPAHVVGDMHEASMAWVGGKKSYARRQILDLMLRNTLLGRMFPRRFIIRADPGQVTCSEGAGLILGAFQPLNILKRGESWDEIAPQVAYDRLTALCAEWVVSPRSFFSRGGKER